MVFAPPASNSGDMNTTPDAAPPQTASFEESPTASTQTGPRVTYAEMRNVATLSRTVGPQRKVAGVAGGVARHLDIDPTLVRVGFVVLALFGGGLLLYVALWLLLPTDGGKPPKIKLDERSLMVALIAVAVLTVLIVGGDAWGQSWIPVPLIGIGLLVWLAISHRSQPAAPSFAAPAGTEQTSGLPAGQTTGPPNRPANVSYVAPRPVDPRKRGPILFWFTLALITLSLGVLGMVDVAGAHVPTPAYAALATGLSGVMLIVGALFGRPGGIIMLGLFSAFALAVTSVGDHVTAKTTTITPDSSVGVASTYEQGAGEFTLDLTEVSDVAALDQRHVSVDMGAGQILVLVPAGIDVRATASIGAGSAQVFDQVDEGLGAEAASLYDAPGGDATLFLDIELGAGEVIVKTP
jgi:phage shock protein PspC (stress-responsive transcriptional regulator)